MNKKITPLFEPIVFILVAVSMISILVSYVRFNGDKIYPQEKFQSSYKDIIRWLQKVSDGNAKFAIFCARKLSDDSFNCLPNPDYLDLLHMSKLSTALITSPFSEIDAKRWIASFRSAKIAKSILAECKDDDQFPEKLMIYLNGNFKISNDENLKRREGNLLSLLDSENLSSNAILRLSAEISIQAGFEAMVVTIHSEKQENICTMLELRKNKQFHTIFPQKNQVWKNASVQKIIKNRKDAEIAVPILSHAKFARYHLPAEPSDFKIANWELRNNIAKIAPKLELPIFGLSPLEQIKNAISARMTPDEAVPPSLFAYWHYPFQALKADENLPALFSAESK